MTKKINLTPEIVTNIAKEIIEKNITTRKITKNGNLTPFAEIIQKYLLNAKGKPFSRNSIERMLTANKNEINEKINKAVHDLDNNEEEASKENTKETSKEEEEEASKALSKDKTKEEASKEEIPKTTEIPKKKILTVSGYNKNLANEIIKKAKDLENNEEIVDTVSLKPTIETEETISKPMKKISTETPAKVIITTPAKIKTIKEKIKKLPKENELFDTLYSLHYYNKPESEIIDFINKNYTEPEKEIIFNKKPIEIVIKRFKEIALEQNLKKLNNYSNLSNEQIQAMKQQGLIDDNIENEINKAKQYVYETTKLENMKRDYLSNPAYNHINKQKIISLLNNGFNPALLKHP